MADTWVYLNSAKAIEGVYGSKAAASRHASDPDGRSFPFDVVNPQPGGVVWVYQLADLSIGGVFGTERAALEGGFADGQVHQYSVIEPKATSILAQPAPLPEPIVSPEPVAEPVADSQPEESAVISQPAGQTASFRSDDSADALANALQTIVAVLTNAKAPKPILDAVNEIAQPALNQYHSATESHEASTESDEVDESEAMDFLFGNESVEATPEVQEPQPSTYDEDLEGVDDVVDAPQPISGFKTHLHDAETGVGPAVLPEDAPINEGEVASLSSWLLPTQQGAQNNEGVII